MCDSIAASVFAVPVESLPTSDGTDLGQKAVLSDLSPPLHDNNAPNPGSITAPASSRVAVVKLCWELFLLHSLSTHTQPGVQRI